MSKIISFLVSNIKRVEVVQMTVENDNLIIFTGGNTEGKSSAIDGITYALAGKSIQPEQPIREGEEKAKVIVETTDLIVTRTWTTKGTYVDVKPKGDIPLSGGPQELLNKLWNAFTFDPLAFESMDDNKQRAILLKLAGLDKIKIKMEAEIDRLLELRKPYNSDYLKYQNLLKDLPEPEINLPDKLISVTELVSQKDDFEKKNKVNDNQRKELADMREQTKVFSKQLVELKEDVTRAEEELKRVMAKYVNTQNQYDQSVIAGVAFAEEVTKLNDIDLTDITTAILTAEKVNEKIRVRNSRVDLVNMRDEAYKTKEDYTLKIETSRSNLKKEIKKAKYPVEGLGFNETGVTFNDLPFNQSSHAERIEISFAIGMALNPKLRAIFSKNADKLDPKRMLQIKKLAEDNDFQFFLERVYEDQLPAVIIEDGKVKGWKNINTEQPIEGK